MLSFVFIFVFFLHLLFFSMGFFFTDSMGIFFDWSFFVLGGLDMGMSFLFDWISMFFSGFVFLISSLVIFYSRFYMDGDIFMRRFIFGLLLFVLSMVMLIFSASLFSLMIGWDGLGLVSFCLVIYYGDKVALTSGLLTVYSNRLGDLFFMFSIYYSFLIGMWGFEVDLLGDSIYLSFFIFLCSLTSSAQFPFSAWLPAAMAAPTPISSLVHSSTLVTAGAYLVIRFSFLLTYYYVGFFLSFLSALTMFVSGLNAVFEVDMKKLVAMSTLSQLGLMFFLLSLGEWMFSFYHLLVHALFKSLMFLSCGGFIFNFSGDQDSRAKGSSVYSLPLFSFNFFVSSLGLMGFPFLAGFYSKDMALDLIMFSEWFFLLYLMFILGCFFTLIYSLKVLFLYLGGARLSGTHSIFYSSFYSSVGLILLGGWVVIVGVVIGWFILDGSFVFFFFPFKTLGVFLIFSFLLFFFFFKYGYSVLEYYYSMMSGLFFISTYSFKNFMFSLWLYLTGDYDWLESGGASGMNSLMVSLGSILYRFDLLFYLLWLVIFSFWGFVSLVFFFYGDFFFF